MRGRLRIESSSESRGAIHQIIKQAMRIENAYHPQCFDRPVLQFLDLKNHHADISSTSTIKPVLDCVSASITHKRTNITRPSHIYRIHPQQSGNNAQIAAAAWLGFVKPNPCRTKSPTTKSIIVDPIYTVITWTSSAEYLTNIFHKFSFYEHLSRYQLQVPKRIATQTACGPYGRFAALAASLRSVASSAHFRHAAR